MMTLPINPKRFEYIMDPTDRVDHQFGLSGLLSAGEDIATIAAAAHVDSAALGFQIESAAPYEPARNGIVYQVWLSVDSAQWASPAWSGTGTDCAVEVTITTTSTPPRRIQRTAVVRVQQQ